jgi:ligand-binding sensor domain-containing protein/signal transduction histidine kinase
MSPLTATRHGERPPPTALVRARAHLITSGVLLAWLAVSPSAWALDPGKALSQFPHRVWQTENGLPQSSTLALAQTPDGYLWVGTFEGLARFDGERFTVFDPANTAALLDRSITALAVDRSGTLWINTNQGMAGMRGGSFFPVHLPSNVVVRDVHQLFPARDGSVWIATFGSGLVWMSENRFQVWKTEQGLASNEVLALAEDNAGGLWVATSAGLQRWNGSKFLPGPSLEGLSSLVSSLAVDEQGTLWVGTDGGIVYQLREGGLRPVQEVSLPGSTISALLADRRGALWVASRGQGLLRLANGQTSHLPPKEGLEGSIFCLLEDAEGSLWLGMGANGLYRLKDAPFTPYGTPEGMGHDVVTALREARDGSLWFSTLGGGISRWMNGQMSTWSKGDGLMDNQIYGIAEGRDGTLWFASRKGLIQWRDGVFTNLPELGQSSKPAVGYAIYEDEHDTLWAGTRQGLSQWDGNQFTELAGQEKVLGATVRVLERRAAGGFWIGTEGGGLAWYDKGRVLPISSRGNPLRGDVRSILEDDGTLWIGTTDGLFRWKNGRFSMRMTRTQGLFDDVILNILADGRGNLWMTCNKGIFRVSRQELEAVADGRLSHVTSRSYGTEDGMRAQECNSLGGSAGIRARDGRLWFPTIRGAVAYDESFEKKSAPLPPALVEELWVDGRQVPASQWTHLPPGEGRVEIHYTSPALGSPDRLRFRYQIEGVDTNWVDAGPRRFAVYTRLPPGDHRFLVQVLSSEGGQPLSQAEVVFHMEPRFFETTLFRVACGLAAVLVLAGGLKLRLRRALQRELQLQARVDERTAELALRLQQLETARERLAHAEKLAAMGTLADGVGHEINNPLAYILSNLRFLSKEMSTFKKSEEDVERWQEVEEALSDALQGAERVRKIVQALRTLARAQVEPPRRVELHATLDHALEMMDPELRSRARIVQEYGAPLAVLGDETRLSQVFHQLLINAAQAIPKGQPESHEIRITTYKDTDGRAVIEVRDSGHGIAPDVLPRIFDPFFTTKEAGEGTGLGLSICHSTIEAMRGEIEVESELGRGSAFRILLPPFSEESTAAGPRALAPGTRV